VPAVEDEEGEEEGGGGEEVIDALQTEANARNQPLSECFHRVAAGSVKLVQYDRSNRLLLPSPWSRQRFFVFEVRLKD